jgi:hypothetical protein
MARLQVIGRCEHPAAAALGTYALCCRPELHADVMQAHSKERRVVGGSVAQQAGERLSRAASRACMVRSLPSSHMCAVRRAGNDAGRSSVKSRILGCSGKPFCRLPARLGVASDGKLFWS